VYVDKIRFINIPNIGERLVRCAGGHRCNRTHFKPILKLSDDSIIQASNNISFDNLMFGSIPEYNPMQTFTPATNGERSNSFTFTVPDPSVLNNDCQVLLSCESQGFCHNSISMVYLVGQRSDNDEYILIFADCVAPGTINAKLLGSVPCNEDIPVDCDNQPIAPPNPTPSCNYLGKTQANISFANINIPFESIGDQDLIDQLLVLIYNNPHTVPITTTINSITADPYLIGTINETIQVFIIMSILNNGDDTFDVQIGLNILQTASAYPFVYSVSFIETLSSTDGFCTYTKADGQAQTGNGISSPAYTGDGNEDIEVIFL
jgi:hypothetical protein